jgi:hypothetical protein
LRDNDGFMSGMVAGLALGALVVMAAMPQTRRPVMRGANELGNRMTKMWRRRGEMMEEMLPGDTI